MKNILLIGVGGTGSEAVDILYKQKDQFGNQTDNHITALVFDTDVGSIKEITSATKVSMADAGSVGTICDRIGTQNLREWFPCDDKAVRAQEMVRGASQWRKKSYLAFLNLMNKPMARQSFLDALEKMVANPGASCEVYVITSVAGGTGSGSFIPIALYAKRYLKKALGKDPIVSAMIALPDIFADSQTADNRIKVYANAYAILRELNAINLVAYNYNEGRTERKKSPIKFKIGDVNMPNVGLLFDASDPEFWTPEAAPFSQIFVLDRIPGVKSVSAHNMVMANSLYSIICTAIGAEFDSEASNHAILHSQNNGSNAIYAGISTAQVRFPHDTVLEYLAREKALDSCESEWLVMHRAVEKKIREKVKLAKDEGTRYSMKDGEYAQMMLDQLEEQSINPQDPITEMVERGTALFSEDGKAIGNTASKYFSMLEDKLKSRIPNKDVTQLLEQNKPENAKDKDAIKSLSEAADGELLSYFQECLAKIKGAKSSFCDSILSFDERSGAYVNKELSLIENLLKQDKKYVHPVAAMVQLCRLRVSLAQFLEKCKKGAWEELRKKNVDDLPGWARELPESEDENAKNAKKSAYAREKKADARFAAFNPGEYEEGSVKTNAQIDYDFMSEDVKALFEQMRFKALEQLKLAVYKDLAHKVDLLIEKYRAFFARFEKEKEDLVEETKTVLRKDCGKVDSLINVYSSIEDKKNIRKDILESAGPETDEQVKEADNVSGLGVFKTVYKAAVAESREDETYNDKDSSAYRSLFTEIIKAYRDYIAKTDAFEKIRAYNIVEAIEASVGNDAGKTENAIREVFQSAQELAEPSLRVDTSPNKNELVCPSTVVVYMLSTETGKYLKRHADDLGLRLPSDQNDEMKIVKTCAEQFVRKYSGNESARVRIVRSMPDSVMYCTGEIMDISPLRIAKFDELGTDNIYFKNYTEALHRYKQYDTDMWNPHIGNNLHKRGFLPYMNPEMETQCDHKMIKALIYGFRHGYLMYSKGETSTDKNPCFRYIDAGAKKSILATDGSRVELKNVAQLIVWFRNQDELIEKWSEGFERDITDELNALPNITSSSEVGTLETAITRSRFMNTLVENFLTDANAKAVPDRDDKGEIIPGKTHVLGISLLEFAQRVRTSEEASVDCDDAERILTVAYEIFYRFVTFRAKPNVDPDMFKQVYRQQLYRAFGDFANCPLVQGQSDPVARRSFFTKYTEWLNYVGVFREVPENVTVDENGNLTNTVPFDLDKTPNNYIERCLAYESKTKAKSAEAADAATEDSAEQAN